MQLPSTIKFGHFNINIKPLDTEIASSSNEEGSFHSNIRTIYLDKSLIEKGGVDLVSVLIHELLHCSFFKNNFSPQSTEEDLVNGFSNDLTELLSRTWLFDFIKQNIKDKNDKSKK